jgi:hypothetical protein
MMFGIGLGVSSFAYFLFLVFLDGRPRTPLLQTFAGLVGLVGAIGIAFMLASIIIISLRYMP